jgi:hypothetical protein
MSSGSYPYQAISAALDDLERDERLCRVDNFIERSRAMDFLELQLDIERADNTASDDAEELRLLQRANALKRRFGDADETLFARLSADIQTGNRAAFKQFVRSVEAQLPAETDDVGYDELDALVNGLLDVPATPGEPQPREPDMIYYQPTPSRIVLKLLDELKPAASDIFYDLGSGLGHVPILVHLLAGIPARGVEIEEVYVRYSMERVKKLCLSQVVFISADARQTDYSDGTIFYLYTPFRGEILRQVLRQLEAQAERRPIRVAAYGPVAAQVARQRWLQATYQSGSDENSLGIFHSL